MAEGDPARRQVLTFQGNVLVATHEQAGAQPYLEAVGAGVPDRLEPRYIDLRIGDQTVEVDRALRDFGVPNLIQPASILDLDPATRSLGDYLDIDLPAISGVEGFPTSMAEWHAAGGALWRPGVGAGSFPTPTDPDSLAGTGARAWADPDERMWTITKLFEQTHADPTLWDTSDLGRSFPDLDWLSPEARPR